MSDAARAFKGAMPLAAQELGETLADGAKKANSVLNGVSDAVGLTDKVAESPYAAVAAALGIGYVLGGGLFTPTTGRLVRLAMKVAAVPQVRDRLLDVAEASLDGVLDKTRSDSSKK